MWPFIKNGLLKNEKNRKRRAKKLLKSIKKISKSSHLAKTYEKEAEDESFLLISEQATEMYLSVDNLVKMLENSDLNISSIIKNSIHVAELQSANYSVIEVYPIIEDDHVVLCPDIHDCEQHKNYRGERIKLVTVRK